MKQLEKILIPTDLSEHSRRALIYGCWLASEQKASLIILHVANEFHAVCRIDRDVAARCDELPYASRIRELD